jgi:hypothetical protein
MTTDQLPALSSGALPLQSAPNAVPLTPPMPVVGLLLPPPPELRGKSYAAALSFVGSARRLGAMANKAARINGALGWFTWFCVFLAIPVTWAFVLIWYIVIFGLFGVFTFPFRLIRRESRKQTHTAQQSLAIQQHMATTQYALAQQTVLMQQQAAAQHAALVQEQTRTERIALAERALPGPGADVRQRPAKSASGSVELPAGHASRDVRTWAAANGIAVAGRGRIPNTVLEQYLAARD